MAGPIPVSPNTSLSSASSSAAYGGNLSIGPANIGAPGGASSIVREVIMGVAIAVLAGLLLRELKFKG